MNMLLTAEELTELTGYCRPSCQIRWLRDNRWPMAVGGDARPKVLRSVLQARLGDNPTPAANEPNLRLCATGKKTATCR